MRLKFRYFSSFLKIEFDEVVDDFGDGGEGFVFIVFFFMNFVMDFGFVRDNVRNFFVYNVEFGEVIVDVICRKRFMRLKVILS